jgi:hypothetical protein
MKELGTLIVVLIVVSTLVNGCDREPSYTSQPAEPTYNATERALKESYNANDIEYDEQMIRDDARAIEQLNRELGN